MRADGGVSAPSGRAGSVGGIAIDGAVVVLLVALVCVPVWPGVFTIDSQAIYRTAIEGRVNTWYAPVLGWMWGVADGLGMPPWGALVVGVAGVVVGLLATYRLWLGPWLARLAAAATVLWPPVYAMLGWVGRDVWFLGLVLAVIALLGWAAKLPDHRRTLVALAAVPAWFAFDARQNGFPVLLVWGGVAAWWAVGRWGWRLAAVPAVALLAVGAGFGVREAANAAIGVQRQYPEQWLYYRDLLAVSLAVDRSQLPPSLFPSQDLEAVRRLPNVHAAFLGPDPLVVFDPYQGGGAVNARLADAWWTMARTRPLDFLRVKAQLYAEQLTLTRPAQTTYFSFSDELGWYASDRFRQSFPELNQRRIEIIETFNDEPAVGGPLFRVWAYLLLGLAGATVLAVVPGPLRVLGVGLLVLQVALQGTLALLAPVIEYRFQLFQVALGVVLAVAGGLTLRAEQPHAGEHRDA